MKPKRTKNPGAFRPGHDPRRHQLTEEERRRGYRRALELLTRFVPLQECRWLLWRAKEARRRRQ